MVKKKILIGSAVVVGIALLGFSVVFGQRLYHNYQRKIGSVNTFAIQNVKTGMDIRPYNAGVPDEIEVIQYTHYNWECMTWQLIKLEDESYLLKNLYTQKTFQPSAEPEEGVTLWQQPLEANKYQYWELLEQEGETYLIRLKGTDLYITAHSEDNNGQLTLMPLANTDSQLWRLISQQPIT